MEKLSNNSGSGLEVNGTKSCNHFVSKIPLWFSSLVIIYTTLTLASALIYGCYHLFSDPKVENVEPVEKQIVLSLPEVRMLEEKCKSYGLYPSVYYWTDLVVNNAARVACFKNEDTSGVNWDAKDL